MDGKKRTEAFILLYLVFIFFLVIIHRASLFRCAGGLFYSYDDAYIHMAMAKNLVRHGVLGITPFAYTPASSSPLWTLLLALFYFVFGVNTWVPLALNIVFFSIFIFVVWKFFSHLPLTWTFVLTFLFILALPGYFVIYMGMEHSLHILLIFLLSEQALKYFSGKRPGWPLYILLTLSMGARYETVFFAFFLLVYAIFKRHWKEAGLIPLSLLPFPLLYGILNIAHGWGFLPASVAVKGNASLLKYLLRFNFAGAFKSFLSDMAFKLEAFSSPALSFEIFIFFLWAFLFMILFAGEDMKRWAVYLFPPYMVLMQFLFALFSYPPRYQNYLLAILVPFTLHLLIIKKSARNPLGKIMVAGLFLGLFVPRFLMNYRTPLGAEGVFSQQYQMAMFLKRFYPGGRVMLNDIGVVSFYNDRLRVDDYVGLATKEPYRIRTSMAGVKAQIRMLRDFLSSSKADLAIAFEKWIKPMVPSNWKEVGRWILLRNLVLPSVEVVFYRINDPSLPAKLRMNSVFLPDVVEAGAYTKMKGFLRYGNMFLWEPERSLFLYPSREKILSLDIPPGEYRVFVRARGLGSSLRIEPLGKIRLNRFPFHPYRLKGVIQNKTLVFRNTSALPLVVREILFLHNP